MVHNAAAARFARGDLATAKAAWTAQAGTPAEALYNLAILADREGRLRDGYDLFKQYMARGGSAQADAARRRIKAKERVLGFGGAP